LLPRKRSCRMIKLPNFDEAFNFENNFYLSSDKSRLEKCIAQYKLFEMVKDVPGDIFEFGVFKGCSLIRFASFRDIFDLQESKAIYGFDIFDLFPETDYEPDKELRNDFINIAGESSISKEQLEFVLDKKGFNNISLIEGDILETSNSFIQENPNVQISLLHIDTDIYEPAKIILETFYDKLSIGGILIVDNYNVFEGETKAVNDFLKDEKVHMKKLTFSKTPYYYIKTESRKF